MRISKKLYHHAKTRLIERYGEHRLPEGKKEFVFSLSNNRKIHKINEVYFIWRKSDKKIITFLTKENVDNILNHHSKKVNVKEISNNENETVQA
jgi:uncharacterized protein YlbG (UPF0298 family)